MVRVIWLKEGHTTSKWEETGTDDENRPSDHATRLAVGYYNTRVSSENVPSTCTGIACVPESASTKLEKGLCVWVRVSTSKIATNTNLRWERNWSKSSIDRARRRQHQNDEKKLTQLNTCTFPNIKIVIIMDPKAWWNFPLPFCAFV